MEKERNNTIYIENLYKIYPEGDKQKVVLNDIDLCIREGEFCSLVGPSGCGKSTLLKILLGQEFATSGTLLIEGKPIYKPDKNRGIVYQKYGLLSDLTVFENIMLGFDLKKAWYKSFFKSSRYKYEQEAMEYIKMARLEEHINKYPHQLSGGQEQRVAIAQAMITKPKILLMDEPFSALDSGTREQMQVFLLDIWEKNRMTIIFVTHDLEEAIYLGTRVISLSQYYTPREKDLKGGATIVHDYKIRENGSTPPRSTKVKYTEQFVTLLEEIRRDGFRPDYLQRVDEFNLKHPDSFRT